MHTGVEIEYAIFDQRDVGFKPAVGDEVLVLGGNVTDIGYGAQMNFGKMVQAAPLNDKKLRSLLGASQNKIAVVGDEEKSFDPEKYKDSTVSEVLKLQRELSSAQSQLRAVSEVGTCSFVQQPHDAQE